MKQNYSIKWRWLILSVVILMSLQITLRAQPTVQTFTYTGSIVNYTVPQCVYTMTMEAWGAQGGSIGGTAYPGGLGAYMSGVFTVTPGQVLQLLVGGQGGDINSGSAATGGGGGSFIARTTTGTPIPMLVAGGGGGRRNSTSGPAANAHAVITMTAQNSWDNSGSGGTNGNGGTSGEPNGNGTGGPGGGFLTNGGQCGTQVPPQPGFAFVNGGQQANTCSPFTSGTSSFGGAGGGGGGCWCYRGTPGGGGGYSGGGAGVNDNAGGGGASYNAGSSQSNTVQARTGHGQLRLSYYPLGSVQIISTPTALCTNGTATLSLPVSMVSYTWSINSNNSTVAVSPVSNTTYSVAATNSLGCIYQGAITVSVNSSTPVLTVPSNTVICLGKTLTLTATGGLSHSWTGGIINGDGFMPITTSTYVVTGYNGCGSASAAVVVSVTPLPLTVTATSTVICANKAATLTALAAANSYTWFPGPLTNSTVIVSPSVNTVYTVSVSDGTCSGTTQIGLTVDPNPTVTIASTGTHVCAKSTITLSATGGINYTWTPAVVSGSSGTVAPTVPTIYQVEGDNSFGCTASAQIAVVTKALPNMNLATTHTMVCAGGPATLNVTGNADAYLWDNTSTTSSIVVNPNMQTTYVVSGTLNSTGCSDTRSITVNVFQSSLPVSPSSSVCQGSAITLTAGPATGYLWSNGATFNNITVTPSVTTTYTVGALTQTAGLSCPVSNSVVVTVAPRPVVTAVATRTAICRNETTTLTAGGASTYTWSTNKTGSPVTFSNTSTVLHQIQVFGTDANGCKDTGYVSVKVNQCTGLDEATANGNILRVYPNPSKGDVIVEGFEPGRFVIVNELGQLVAEGELKAENAFRTEIRNLAAGVYFLSQPGQEDQKVKILIGD